MRTRQEAIKFCLSLPDTYEDYPFHDPNWTVMRLGRTKKSFAFIFEREEKIWINVKCDPEWILFWRETYPSVIPAYHLNKKHWNSLILDGTIPDKELKRMISESYDLVASGR